MPRPCRRRSYAKWHPHTSDHLLPKWSRLKCSNGCRTDDRWSVVKLISLGSFTHNTLHPPGAVGFGVNENILSAYNFLVNNYTVGDELFLFGFSRGSFTCRSLAGMISQFGILKQEEAGEWFAGIWDRYQGTVRDEQWEIKKDDVTHSVNIKLIGCWDTVGSLGIPESPLTKFFNLNREHAFHDTELSDSESLPQLALRLFYFWSSC
jgi:hypothetical protein